MRNSLRVALHVYADFDRTLYELTVEILSS